MIDLLGTRGSKNSIQEMLLIKYKIINNYLTPSAVVGAGTEAKLTLIMTQKSPIDDQSKLKRLELQKSLLFQTNRNDQNPWQRLFVTTEWIEAVKQIQQPLFPNGIHEVHTKVAFQILLTNVLKKPVALKKTCVLL